MLLAESAILTDQSLAWSLENLKLNFTKSWSVSVRLIATSACALHAPLPPGAALVRLSSRIVTESVLGRRCRVVALCRSRVSVSPMHILIRVATTNSMITQGDGS